MQGSEGGTKLRYWLTLVSGMVECLCFAGVVFGYASLVFILKADGYFNHLCDDGPGVNGTGTGTDCSRQDQHFSLVFTIASFLNNFLCFINGFLFDQFGTMVTRLLGIFLYTTGSLLVAFSTPASSELLFPALACLAVGGILLLMTNMQVGNLFCAHRSTVITLYNGAFDSSSVVFVLFKVLYERGVSLRSSFLVLSFCSVFHLVRTLVLMPRSHIPHPLPHNYTYGLSCGRSNSYNVEQFEKMRDGDMTTGRSQGDYASIPAPEDATADQKPGQGRSFRSCVLSWFFLFHLLWLSIMQLRHYLFIGTLNPRLIRLAGDDAHRVSQFTNGFAVTQLCGVLCAPWNGLIMDRNKGKPLAPGEGEREAELRSSFLSLLVTSVLGVLFSVCASVPVLWVQYLTFGLQVLSRSFLYGGNAAFISIAFPSCHFGKVYGLVMCVSAVVSLLQFPCFALIEGPLGGDPFKVDVALTLVSLLTFVHPVYVLVHCSKLSGPGDEAVQTDGCGPTETKV